jgi:hypothetical protein
VEVIVVAIVTGMFGLVGIWLSNKYSRSAAKSSQSVVEKLSTNHGKEPWEYLEMIGEIRDHQVAMEGRFETIVKMNAADHELLHRRLDAVEKARLNDA